MPALPIISAIVGAVGTGVSIYGQAQAANAAQDAAAYNNKLAEQAARNKELEAVEAIKRERDANRARLGEIRARLGTTGTLADEGSPLLILGESAGRLELGIQDAARNASMQAAAMRAQGKMGLWEADQAQSASIFGMAATGLKGLTSQADAYQSNVKLGVYNDTFGIYAPRTKTIP